MKDTDKTIKELSNQITKINEQLAKLNELYKMELTKRKYIEKELNLSEHKFAKVFNVSPYMMVISRVSDNVICEANQAFLQTIGYTREEVIGRTAKELKLWTNQEQRKKIINMLHKQGSVRDEKVYFNLKSSDLCHLFLSGDVIELEGKEYYLFNMGIEQNNLIKLKHVEENIRLSEERFLKAFYNNPTPMVIVRFRDDMHIDVNKSYQRIFGFTREEIIGRTVLDLSLFVDVEKYNLHKKILLEQGYVYNLDVLFKTRQGEIRNVLMSGEIIELNHEKCRLISLNDITDYKKIENEMARLERLNLIGQMSGSIAHEIRNPLTIVRGFLQLLGSKDNYSEEKKYFKLMIDELDRVNSIIIQFLSLARNKHLDKTLQNLNEVIKAILPLIQADAVKSNIQIIAEFSEVPNLPLDQKEIIQLVLNLVRNGMEAMSTEGKLTIATYFSGKEVVLAVKDQGKGIEPSVLEKIGTPFFTTKDTGTGLGLANCYSIAERHNAKIDIDTCSTGTIFKVSFKVES